MANVAFVNLNGMEKFLATLKRLGNEAPKIAALAIYREAERIMTDSKEHYVPVAADGGSLKASGQVQPPEIKGGLVKVVMGYGNSSVKYALAVHEHLSEHSPPSWIKAEESGRGIHWHLRGRGPKYLELPVNKARKGMDARLAADVKREIERMAKA